MTELEQLKKLQKDFELLYNSYHHTMSRYFNSMTQDLEVILQDQVEFSEKTFGPGNNTEGLLDHIRSELEEVEAEPSDIMEWIDVAILAFDGAWRNGYTPKQIVDAYKRKLEINKNRQWPDWRTAEAGKAIEHIDNTKE